MVGDLRGCRRFYADEAGDGTLVRNLLPEKDAKISLFVGISFAPEIEQEATDRLKPHFDRFCEAAPVSAKIHITDAFASTCSEWRSAALATRNQYIDIMLSMGAVIVFAARRNRLSRELHALLNIPDTPPSPGSPIRVAGLGRPSNKRIDDDLMTMFALRLDAFAQDIDPRPIELLFDALDQATLGRYKAAIERTRNIGNRTVPIKFWNVDTRLPGTASIRFSVNSYQAQLTSQMISHASVAGKSSPLVLAADITANHLLHHLQTLPSDARLNAPSSIADWELQPCVWGVSQNAIDDIL
jgi:hypothetical protein